MTGTATAREALDAARTNRTQGEIEAAVAWLGKAWGVASVFREATADASTAVLSAAHMLETLRDFLEEAAPVVFDLSAHAADCIDRAFGVSTTTASDALLSAALGVGLHTLAIVVVTGTIAVAVYEWIGVEVLKRAWINLDIIWVLALVGAGAWLLLLP